MEHNQELDRLSVIAMHLEHLREKLYKKDITFSSLERALLYNLAGEKLNLIFGEATKLLPKPNKGRPLGASDKVLYKEFQIANEYHNRLEPSQSESLYEYLRTKYGFKNRSSIVKAIKRGREFPATVNDNDYQRRRGERALEVKALMLGGLSELESYEELSRRSRQRHTETMEMLDMLNEGKKALEEIKY